MYIPSLHMGEYDKKKETESSKAKYLEKQGSKPSFEQKFANEKRNIWGLEKQESTGAFEEKYLNYGSKNSQTNRSYETRDGMQGWNGIQMERSALSQLTQNHEISQSSSYRKTSSTYLSNEASEAKLETFGVRNDLDSHLSRLKSRSYFDSETPMNQLKTHTANGKITCEKSSHQMKSTRKNTTNGSFKNMNSSKKMEKCQSNNSSRVNMPAHNGARESLSHSLERKKHQPERKPYEPSCQKNNSLDRHVARSNPSKERDTNQYSKARWQDSLRGSSTPLKSSSTRLEKKTMNRSQTLDSTSYRRRSRSKSAPRRSQSSSPDRQMLGSQKMQRSAQVSSRSLSRQRSFSDKSSTANRLFSSTFSSRAKETEAIESQSLQRKDKTIRASKSPARPLNKSATLSSIHRRSKSPGPKTSNPSEVLKRRSIASFPDDALDAENSPDPLSSYTSWKQFRSNRSKSFHESQLTQGSIKDNKGSTLARSTVSQASASKKISSSYTQSHSTSYNKQKVSSQKGSALSGASISPISFPDGVGRTLTGEYKTESSDNWALNWNFGRNYSQDPSSKIALSSLRQPGKKDKKGVSTTYIGHDIY